ncbi:MAG: DUF3800 domain-containing protein [Candidatus Poribacteria bacterium]|nr:DUF3800 domain-containing protein [Candidatus Poribacteria bacterium]
MSWLLFLDESGHDHRSVPYEIHGGFAVQMSKLWPLMAAVRTLEQSMFGAYLHQYGSEIKGSKLLHKDRFRWANQAFDMGEAEQRKHALNFLNNGTQNRAPRREEFTAYGKACIGLAERVIELLRSHDASVFAAIIPRSAKPATQPNNLLRKDLVFLLERYYYFLESKQEPGILVMDGTEKQADRKLIQRMERYFTRTENGRRYTQWIVPVPFFVDSDMAYGVQIADLCIYCMNWGMRLKGMTEPTREEIVPFAHQLSRLVWRGDGYRDGETFQTNGAVYVPDPYENRE